MPNTNGNNAEKEQTKAISPAAVITPLGTGGWIPVKGRHTACYVFKKGNMLVILDFGTGISRLFEERDYLLNGVEHVYGFLSHYHPDHTSGFPYLPAFFKDRKLELYAPGQEIYGEPADVIFRKYFSPPSLPRLLDDFLPSIVIKDIPIEGMTIMDTEIKFRVQMKHVHPTVAIRIGNHVAYCTDTEPDYETIGFAMGAKVLLHECWYEDQVPMETVQPSKVRDLLAFAGKNGHSSNLGVGLIAREAHIRATHTIHHNPVNSLSQVQKIARIGANVATYEMQAAEDGLSINC